jgi:hypothetical protein
MKFVDPLPIDCPACETRSEQRIGEFFALRACCPHCGHSFEAVGRWIRETADENHKFWTWAEIVVSIEDKLGITTNDTEICERLRTVTLRDIVRFIQQYLPQTTDVDQVAIQNVLEAARELVARSNAARAHELSVIDTSSLDEPLLDSLYPNRWERTYPPTS